MSKCPFLRGLAETAARVICFVEAIHAAALPLLAHLALR